MIGTNNARSEGRSSLCSFDIHGSQVYSSFVIPLTSDWVILTPSTLSN